MSTNRYKVTQQHNPHSSSIRGWADVCRNACTGRIEEWEHEVNDAFIDTDDSEPRMPLEYVSEAGSIQY